MATAVSLWASVVGWVASLSPVKAIVLGFIARHFGPGFLTNAKNWVVQEWTKLKAAL